MKKQIFLLLSSFCLILSSCGESPSSSQVPPSTQVPPSSQAREPDEDDNYRSYYQIFVGAFADSNGDGVGDLKGIEDKLDYISDLGFRGIWLSPIFQSPSYHKYNTEDYFKVDPSLGTNDDLISLVRKAHEKNIKVILDLAINHSSRRNEMYKKAKAAYAKLKGEANGNEQNLLNGLSQDEIEEYSRLYVFDDKGQNPGGKVFRRVDGHSFYVESTFDSDMPEFNFDSNLAWTYFNSIIDHYMNEVKVDGLRLDAVKYYYLGDGQKNYVALNKIEKRVKDDNPYGYVVAENWSSNGIIDAYYKNTNIDSYFYFPAQGASGFIGAVLKKIGQRSTFLDGEKSMIEGSYGKIPAPFLSNHDTGRFTRSKVADAKFLYGCFASLTGNTFSYYGDEIGMAEGGNSDPDYRTHIEWGDSYSCKDFSGSKPSTYPMGSVKDQIEDSNSLLNYIKKANKIRMSNDAIIKGKITNNSDEYTKENLLLSIDKKVDDKEVRIVYNFDGTKTSTYKTSDGFEKVLDELTIDNTTIENKGDSFEMKPYSILFLTK